jgi:hypothetical protein
MCFFTVNRTIAIQGRGDKKKKLTIDRFRKSAGEAASDREDHESNQRSIYLALGARARAFLNSRGYVVDSF